MGKRREMAWVVGPIPFESNSEPALFAGGLGGEEKEEGEMERGARRRRRKKEERAKGGKFCFRKGAEKKDGRARGLVYLRGCEGSLRQNTHYSPPRFPNFEDWKCPSHS